MKEYFDEFFTIGFFMFFMCFITLTVVVGFPFAVLAFMYFGNVHVAILVNGLVFPLLVLAFNYYESTTTIPPTTIPPTKIPLPTTTKIDWMNQGY